MAFNNSITARYDELRSPNPPATSNGTGGTTPSSRYSGSFLPNHSQPFGSEARASLQRRQTTDLSKMPPMTPIGQQPTQAMESVDMSASVSRSNSQLLFSRFWKYAPYCHCNSHNIDHYDSSILFGSSFDRRAMGL